MRKLLLETAKFNVITAHHNREVVELIQRFPNVDGVVLVTEGSLDCESLARTIKNLNAKLPIIFLSPRFGASYGCADRTLSSYEPEKLLELARSLFGDPLEMDLEGGKQQKSGSRKAASHSSG